MPLPTYAFERTPFWTNSDASIYVTASTKSAKPKTKTKRQAKAKKQAKIKTEGTPAPTGPACLVHYGTALACAKVKLYCFPFAGGSSSAFANWARSSPDWLEVVAIEPADVQKVLHPHANTEPRYEVEAELI